MKQKQLNDLYQKMPAVIRRYGVVSLLLLIFAISIVDYYDLGVLVGWGWFNKNTSPNLAEVIAAILLFFTFNESLKTNREAQRQTEISVRPYLRLSWVTTQIGDNRRSQGITDTCLVASNNGSGLMRSVKYNILVNGKSVGVRNHAVIVPNTSTNIVYDDVKNKGGATLGCRNDKDFENKNNIIILNSKIEVSGSYRDIEGGKYVFNFIADTHEQSWFKEKYRQQQTNKQY